MRRVLRHPFTLCSAASLVLCIAVCVLWVRSFAGAGDQVLWTPREPAAHWGPSHYMMGPSPFPVLDEVEKYAAGSLRGRLRLRRVSWFSENRTLSFGLFGGNPDDIGKRFDTDVPPGPIPDGVTSEPGLAWTSGDAMRIDLWLEHREMSRFGFTAEQGFWDGPFTSGFGPGGHWSAFEQAVEVPHWSLALLTLILPASLLRRTWTRRRRYRAGLCVNCGYDLRATPDRCPECAAVTPTARAEIVMR